MDRRERVGELTESVVAAFRGLQSGIWTAIPAIVQSYDPAQMTITAQPSIQCQVRSFDGNPPLPGAVLAQDDWWWVNLPLLVDVPVCFQGGGGFTASFPIAKGDEALIVFASRPIDNWWYLGGVQTQPFLSMHDIGDGFAVVGLRSLPRVVGGLATDAVQIRNDAGDSKVEIKGNTINVTTTSAVNLTAPAVHLSNGGTVRKLVNDLFQAFFNSHVHTSAGSGSPTSAPTVAMDNAKLTSVTQAE